MNIATKVGRIFVFTFLGVFLPALASVALNLSDTVDWSAAKAALVSAIFAACAAGIRTVVAFLPVFPDDNVGLKRTP